MTQDWTELLVSPSQPGANPPDATYLLPLHGISGVIFSGEDAGKFLQSQLSNDINLLPTCGSIVAAYCSPKGRVLALPRLLQWGGSILALLPQEIMPSFMRHISVFILRAQVRLGVLPATSCVAGVIGCCPKLPGTLTGISMPGGTRSLLIGMTDDFATLVSDTSERLLRASISVWQRQCIADGEAQVVASTRELFTPQMLDLDLSGAISFDKGCYPGQEIVARTHYRGRPKQRLFRAQSAPDATLEAGSRIVVNDARAALSGHVVRADPESGHVLASIRLNDRDAELRLESGQSLRNLAAVHDR